MQTTLYTVIKVSLRILYIDSRTSVGRYQFFNIQLSMQLNYHDITRYPDICSYCLLRLSYQKSENNYKFFDKNTNMFTFTGFSRVRLDVTTLPQVLKTRSEGVLVAQMHKYLCAILERHGNSVQFTLHHSRGSDSGSGLTSRVYFSISCCTLSNGVPDREDEVSLGLSFWHLFRKVPILLFFAGGSLTGVMAAALFSPSLACPFCFLIISVASSVIRSMTSSFSSSSSM